MKKYIELEQSLKRHKKLYYQGNPEISDTEYDKLEDELRALRPDSYVLRMIGSSPSGQEKVKHKSKMLSLSKTYKEDDLITWKAEHEIVSTFKIDGVSCSLVYQNGLLSVGKTRGDGSVGENITDKCMWIAGILPEISLSSEIEVRGEIYCTEENFLKLSNKMIERGLEKPTSLRNIVAGLIGRKENIDLCTFIEFQAFDLIEEKPTVKTEIEKLKILQSLGFLTPEVTLHIKPDTIASSLAEAQEFMNEGNYQIDGLVFSYNDLSLHEELGSTSHHPRFKMAFKFQGVSKETEIVEIFWQVSRNGILTPIAQVKPVELSGAMISRVTLHNYGVVLQNNLKSGDLIEIIRSGEVIPKFLSVKKESTEHFLVPKKCPSCNEVVEEVEIRLICNNASCPAQVKETILNYIQKIGIDDLSSKRLEELIKADLVKTIPDLYRISKEDLLSLDKVKDKLANKLLSSIESSKKVELTTFLSSLGISGGAYNKCEKVVMAGFNTLEKIRDLNVEKLTSIEGFAEKSAQDFLASLTQKFETIDQLEKLGFVFEEIEIKDSPFKQKKVCITGSLSRKRSEIEKDLRELGAIVVSSVSKNTHYLLTNDKTPSSSKFKKAMALDIPVISEEEFYSHKDL
jgi:DNA ligase (NAD+)